MKKLNIDEFLLSASEYTQTMVKGEIHLIGDQARWGKIAFNDSEIVSLVYADLLGLEALSELGKLNKIRVLYRPPSEQDITLTNDSNSSDDWLDRVKISGEEFFSFFALEYPEAVAKCMKTVKPRALTDKQRNKKIMVMDDSAIARKMISRPLIAAGYSIIEAKDGLDGLGKLKKEKPHLIVLDLIMPGIDGYKVVDLIKKSKKYSNTPIIIVTSKDSLMDKLKGKMSSTDGYITKPFKEENLLEKVNSLLH